jgi:predicted nuclease of predicted toxin-antitoxin system
MQFLVDVHLPISLSKFLDKQQECQAIHVNQILQKWHTTDADICKYADENNMVIITKDSDFKNSHFINKTPQKVLRVTLGNISNSDLIVLFERYLTSILSLSGKTEFYLELEHNQLLTND